MIKGHTFKDWLEVTRYWSFPVSSMPVVVTFAFLCSKGLIPSGIDPVINFILALLGVVILHFAGNVLSDYFDFKTGVDCEEAFAVPNLVFHKYEPKEYLTFSILLFIIGSAIGMFLVFRAGISVLYVGAAGVILTALYSFFKYRALGDLDIFIIFSPLIIAGTTIVVTGAIVPEAFCVAIPIGLITVAVLHANNTLDTETDRKAGARTFAMCIGAKASCRLYIAYMIIPFVCIIGAVIAGYLSPLCLIALVAFVPALKNIKAAAQYKEKGIQAMMGLDQATAKLQLVFSGLLSIALFIAAAIN